MKKILFFCSLFLGIALLQAAVAPGENILINGEFAMEDVNQLTGLDMKSPQFWGPTGATQNINILEKNVPAGKRIVQFAAPAGGKSDEVTLRQMDMTLVPGPFADLG